MKIDKTLLAEKGFIHVDGTGCYVKGDDGFCIDFGNEHKHVMHTEDLDYCEIFVNLDEERSNIFRGFVTDTEQANAIARAMGYNKDIF